MLNVEEGRSDGKDKKLHKRTRTHERNEKMWVRKVGSAGKEKDGGEERKYPWEVSQFG